MVGEYSPIGLTEKGKVSDEIVAFLLFNVDTNRLCVEKRVVKGSAYEGEIIVPAGRIEADEFPRQTLLREIGEEFKGAKIHAYHHLPEFEAEIPNGSRIYFNPYIVFVTGDIRNREPEKSEKIWVTPNEARDILKYETSQKILKGALNVLTWVGLFED